MAHYNKACCNILMLKLRKLLYRNEIINDSVVMSEYISQNRRILLTKYQQSLSVTKVPSDFNHSS